MTGSSFNSYLRLRQLGRVKSPKLLDQLWGYTVKTAQGRFLKNRIVLKQRLSAKFLHKFLSSEQRRFSVLLSKQAGQRIKVNLYNVFAYLQTKRRLSVNHLLTLHFDRRYQRDSKFHTYYHDFINAFVVSAYIKGTESLCLLLIQQSLLKMHYYKVKPKRLFYFLDKALKNIKEMQELFRAYYIIITGKLRGGTARTATFRVGFGPLARQTLSIGYSILFGTVRSTYGSFGIKVLTSRNITTVQHYITSF